MQYVGGRISVGSALPVRSIDICWSLYALFRPFEPVYRYDLSYFEIQVYLDANRRISSILHRLGFICRLPRTQGRRRNSDQ